MRASPPLLERITQLKPSAPLRSPTASLKFSRTSNHLNLNARQTLNQVIRDTLTLVEHQMKTARVSP